MRSLLALSLLATQALAAFELLDPLKLSPDNQTVKYQANPLYSACSCDLTALSCDLNCCCDSDCSPSLTQQQTLAETCSNIDYNTLYGAPLSTCVKDEQIYQYNKKHGLNAYFDPFTKLFCVYISNSPKMDFYYEQKDSVTSEEIDRLINDQGKQGFAGTVFGAEERPLDLQYYQEGDRMYSKLQLPNAESATQQYMRSFPLPQKTSNGECDMFKTPEFMQNEETECTQSFNLEDDCESLMNPLYFTTESYSQ